MQQRKLTVRSRSSSGVGGGGGCGDDGDDGARSDGPSSTVTSTMTQVQESSSSTIFPPSKLQQPLLRPKRRKYKSGNGRSGSDRSLLSSSSSSWPPLMLLRAALLVPLLTLGVILQAGLYVAVPSHVLPPSSTKEQHPLIELMMQARKSPDTSRTKHQLVQEHFQNVKELRRQAAAQKQGNPTIEYSNNPDVVTQVLHKPKAPSPIGDGEDVKYHIIFSTGCSSTQDWQSYLFFYHVYQSGQPGNVTRIVSGCRTPADEETLRNFFWESIQQPMNAADRFHLHFTPDYGLIVKPGTPYKYFNKPFGTRDWMERALGYNNTTVSTESLEANSSSSMTNNNSKKNITVLTTQALDNPEHDDTIVILMDPDQVILRPFVRNDFSGDSWMFLDKKKPNTRIRHGAPMGQMYGFGLQWKRQVTMDYVAFMGYANKTRKSFVSPVDELSFQKARQSYIVGPPYIATARDFYAIVRQWTLFVPRVHDQYPHLLAEMFGYSLAAAHLHLPHQTARSFMVSAMDATRSEGWHTIDEMAQQAKITAKVMQTQEYEKKVAQLCQRRTSTTFPPTYTTRKRRGKNKALPLPRVFHYCQRYHWGPYYFGKHRMPRNILSCESPLLAEPPADLWRRYNYSWLPGARNADNRYGQDHQIAPRQVFSVCTMTFAMNDALQFYKQHSCPPPVTNSSGKTATTTKKSKASKVNFNKNLVFVRAGGHFDSTNYSISG